MILKPPIRLKNGKQWIFRAMQLLCLPNVMLNLLKKWLATETDPDTELPNF